MEKVLKEGDDYKIIIRSFSKGKEAILLVDNQMGDHLREGDRIRVLGAYVDGLEEGVPVLRVRRGGRILRNPPDLLRRDNRKSIVEGIIVKIVSVEAIPGGYRALIVLKEKQEYMTLMVFSNVRSRLTVLKPGLRIRVKVRCGKRNRTYCNSDEIGVLAETSLRDSYYSRVLEVDELKPGLKYVDVKGEVVYVGILKRMNWEGRDIPLREVLLKGREAIIRLRLWREASSLLKPEHQGRHVLLENVIVKGGRNGLELSTSRYTRVRFL